MMTPQIIAGIGGLLKNIEAAVRAKVIADLTGLQQANNRGQCDNIFGTFSQLYLGPCISQSLASRAANFSSLQLIPAVLALEQQRGVQFHKGALFHDTAIAASLAGDEDLFDYLLAMTDEEEFRTANGRHVRGSYNLQAGGMGAQFLAKRLQFACDLLNASIIPGGISFASVTGLPAVTTGRLDLWRLHHLDGGHQFELWRVVHELEVFSPQRFPGYSAAGDNPFVMLRLAKALGHLAQFVESCFTAMPGVAASGKTLAEKLHSQFGNLSNAAGGKPNFVGTNPQTGSAMRAELVQLLQGIPLQAGEQQEWRLLRVLYLVRNSTAHTIDASLPYYSDRLVTIELAQAVFASLFVIRQIKGAALP